MVAGGETRAAWWSRLPARTLVALVAGALLSLAFDPVAVPYVAPLALAALALTTRGLRARAAWLPGLAFGSSFTGLDVGWLLTSTGGAEWAALTAATALYYAAWGLVSAPLHRLRSWPAWLALAWTAQETLRSAWPLGGMPWGRLGVVVVDTPASPLLAYVGVDGATLAVALLGFLLARAVTAVRGPELALAVVAVVVVAGAAMVPAVVPVRLPEVGHARVALIQGGVPGRGDDVAAHYREVTRNQVDATEALAARVEAGRTPRPDFVIWPENSTAVDPFLDTLTTGEIQNAVGAVGVPVLVGAVVDAGPHHVLNQGIVWDPATGAGDRYTKWHPVPYGEYIPYRSRLAGISLRLSQVPRDMLRGTDPAPLRIAGVPLADAICFDVAFDDAIDEQVERGARLVAVQTSNASFVGTDQPEQQFTVTRARAVETGRWIVVSSVNGISGVVDPRGRVVARAPSLARAVLEQRVGLVAVVPPSVRVERALGALTVPATVLGLLVGLPVGLLTARRRAPRRAGRRRMRTDGYAVPPPESQAGRVSSVDARSDPPVATTTPPPTTPVGRERWGQGDGTMTSGHGHGHGRVVMVVPTYDEAANLEWIVGRLRAAQPDVDVLVVDDSSPDGTGDIADALAAADSAVHVLHRTAKEGLGAAYLEGFAWALDRGYDVVGEMDADGSHQPEELGRLLDALDDADLVIGSRWVPGGSVVNWPLRREALSRGGNLYVRLLLGIGVRDATAGFRLFRRHTLEAVDLASVESTGYIFQTDLVTRTLAAGLRIREVPIEFVERVRGDSKMSGAVAKESLQRVTVWGLTQRRARLRAWRERHPAPAAPPVAEPAGSDPRPSRSA